MVGNIMTREIKPVLWFGLSASVTGASHRIKGQPNQDSAVIHPDSEQQEPIIVLAVADGHGSPRSFRSDTGSKFAVQVAQELLSELIQRNAAATSVQEINIIAKQHLPQQIVRAWLKQVEEDLKAQPFNQVEKDHLLEKAGLAALDKLNAADERGIQAARLAYGSTLLVVAVTSFYILYLQLGDGDILVVSQEGEVSRPLKRDSRLIANETTSLCIPQADKAFEVHLQPLFGEPPALILLATDGYSNSFKDEAGFMKVGTDYLGLLKEEGLHNIRQNLSMWLEETSQAGSGDDITLGLICRADLVSSGFAPAVSSPTVGWEEIALSQNNNITDNSVTLPENKDREEQTLPLVKLVDSTVTLPGNIEPPHVAQVNEDFPLSIMYAVANEPVPTEKFKVGEKKNCQEKANEPGA